MKRKYVKQNPHSVRHIRRLYRQGWAQNELAYIHDACAANVHYIVTRKTWREVG